MQSATVNADDEGVSCRCKKSYERISSTCDQDQGNFSLNLWKNAFKDALKRLCPVRAGGCECGCLPMLVKLVTHTLSQVSINHLHICFIPHEKDSIFLVGL